MELKLRVNYSLIIRFCRINFAGHIGFDNNELRFLNMQTNLSKSKIISKFSFNRNKIPVNNIKVKHSQIYHDNITLYIINTVY